MAHQPSLLDIGDSNGKVTGKQRNKQTKTLEQMRACFLTRFLGVLFLFFFCFVSFFRDFEILVLLLFAGTERGDGYSYSKRGDMVRSVVAELDHVAEGSTLLLDIYLPVRALTRFEHAR